MSKKIVPRKFPWGGVMMGILFALFVWLYISHIIEKDKHSIYYNPGQDPNLVLPPPAEKESVFDYLF